MQFPGDLVKFTEEILDENFIFYAAFTLQQKTTAAAAQKI